MNNHIPGNVREAYERYIRSYNAHDSHEYWGCFHWPHTAIEGSSLVVHDRPQRSLTEIKQFRGWMYQQIITLQVVAYSEHTAHVVVRLAYLDDHKKLATERDMVYIYKKILDEWKIYVVSEADSAQDNVVGAEA
jgi:hypothetical protein